MQQAIITDRQCLYKCGLLISAWYLAVMLIMEGMVVFIPGIKIKICGLRRLKDIEYINIVMPDYAGFILAEGFKRSITKEQAEKFVSKLDRRIKRTGVFVNQPGDIVADYVNSGIIQYVQLHGDEDNNYIQMLGKYIKKECAIIKAVRVKSKEDIENAQKYNCDYLLFDTYTDSGAGGSGMAFNWTLVKNIKQPFFLAGGLSASNVKEAVEITMPYAVDVSSSVETDGCKDLEKMQEFVKAVREYGKMP